MSPDETESLRNRRDVASSCWMRPEDEKPTRTVALAAGLELRYSPSCEAVWTRLSGPLPAGAKGAPQAKVIRNQDGRTYTCTYARRDQRSCWTKMLNERGFQSYAFAEYDTGMGVQRARTGAY